MFTFTLDPAMTIQLLVAVILPILVGLVTTRVTASSTKSWLLAGLTLVTSLLTQLGNAVAHHVTFDLGLALLTVIPAFAISVATYYGLWKPTGISNAAQELKSTTLIQ
jgi:hypothetical protein